MTDDAREYIRELVEIVSIVAPADSDVMRRLRILETAIRDRASLTDTTARLKKLWSGK